MSFNFRVLCLACKEAVNKDSTMVLYDRGLVVNSWFSIIIVPVDLD